MKIYKQSIIELQEVKIPQGVEISFSTDTDIYYTFMNNDIDSEIITGMEEVSQADYEAVGGIIPGKEAEISLPEIKENQIILMEAEATIYETLLELQAAITTLQGGII